LWVREAGLARSREARVPGQGDRSQLVVGQLCDRSHMTRSVDDDLLVLERGEEVRHHAHLPAITVRLAAGRSNGEGLRRRPVLAPLAERALLELLGRRRVVVDVFCAGPPRALWRDDDGAA
jgi:hypothetical protein